MKLQAAQSLARELVEMFRPWCKRVEIAGSIRRQKPEVGDLEIVLIPKWEQRPDTASLFAQTETLPVNLLWEVLQPPHVIVWIKPGVSEIVPWPIKPDGKYWRGLILRGRLDAPADIKLDVFLARPENFGVIYTIRTGSADFSRALVTHARDRTDYRVDGGELKYKGETVACPDEETLFASLNLKWIEPRARGGDRDLFVP